MATKTIAFDRKLIEYIPVKQRNAIPHAHFAWPDAPDRPEFPCDTQDHLDSCAKLLGHAPENMQAKIKARAIRIAHELGLTLPDSWKSDDSKAKENVQESTPFIPKSRVATFKTKFLSDGAQSRNRRSYPQESVNKLVSSAQLALETPGSDPLTCYISHKEADDDNSLKLAGTIKKVWKQGNDAWARIEMPDTQVGREAATLAKFGALKTSLRATGAELRPSKSGGLPEVSGENLRLLGIDFTTTPGIETVTVEDVTLESANHATPQDINEIFELPTESLLLEEASEEEELESDQAWNEFINRLRIAKEFHTQEASSNGHDLLIANKSTMQAIHDHIALAQGRSCASGSSMEAGRRFSASTQSQLDQAHDKAAEVLGIACSGSTSSVSGDDGMADGDDDDGTPQENTSTQEIVPEPENNLNIPQEETETMTPEEMIAALKEAGFSVEPPKTAEEKLQEALNAKLAELETNFNAKLEEAKKQLVASGPKPQRQSLVEGGNQNSTTTETNPKVYRKGSYLTERLKGMDWAELADRERPLPDGIDATRLLQEFGHLYLMKTGYYDQA